MMSQEWYIRYANDGLCGLQGLQEARLSREFDPHCELLKLIVEKDDEAAFDFLVQRIDNFYYYKELVRISSLRKTTKYLRKSIQLKQLLLLDLVEEDILWDENPYTFYEIYIVVKAYLEVFPYDVLWQWPEKSKLLTEVLEYISEDV